MGSDTTEWPEYYLPMTLKVVYIVDGTQLTEPAGRRITRYRVPTPLNGTTYTYRVRADDDDVIRGGLWSNEKSVTTPANVPGAPGPLIPL